MMNDEEKVNRRASLEQIRKHLRAGSALDMAEGQPYADGGANPSSEEAGVAQRIIPQHDVGGLKEHVSKDRGADGPQPSGRESARGPQASDNQRASGKSEHITSVEYHSSAPSEEPQRRKEEGFAMRDGDASAKRASRDAATRREPHEGPGEPPPKRDRSGMPEPTMQEKPGYDGPGWREDGYAGEGAAEKKAREDAKGRTAEGEPGDESDDKDLVAGLIHVAKKYKAP